ncbi:hypothetical protein RN001_005494 [Aquatica leii]|uniref:THAP-type domain-containing protein n=1 Tax=Aquatica leii TaxID=1421715 RepID=A0AAN7P6M3_9COLE|nr:hypothetical protein RN001_005494 [Aquatica leii]
MVLFCCVVGCASRGQRDAVKFFRIPAELNYKHKLNLNELSRLRRQKWLSVIKREDLDEKKIKYAVVCSTHFITDEDSVDDPNFITSGDEDDDQNENENQVANEDIAEDEVDDEIESEDQTQHNNPQQAICPLKKNKVAKRKVVWKHRSIQSNDYQLPFH